MKLPTKTDVTKQKAAEKQREIEEGMKLAKRVDTLRGVAAEEEASLEKFRRETVAQISEEISRINDKREALSREVKELEDRKKSALEPLAELEEKLDKRRVDIEHAEGLLREEGAQSEQRSHDLDVREKLVVKAETQARYTQEEAKRQYEESVILKEEAEKRLRSSELIHSRSVQEASTRERHLQEREQWLREREDACLYKEEALRKQEIELAKELTRIRDREQVLERNLLRVKNGKR